MPDSLPVAKQIAVVRDLLTQTQLRKVLWQTSGSSDSFTADRPQATAILDRVDDPPRIRLRFSAKGRSDFDMTIMQALPDAQQFPQEQELDAFLSLLHQYVAGRIGQRPSAADLFLENVGDDEITA
jgi:hypothetical protein